MLFRTSLLPALRLIFLTAMATTPALRAALRSIRSRPVTGFSQQRLFVASARRQANERQQQSFKSQLYESTQQRLKRERAEQERFARYQTQSPGGRYAALVFGMSRPQAQLRCCHRVLSLITGDQHWFSSRPAHTI